MAFLFFDGPASAERRGFRFEVDLDLLCDFEAVIGFGDGEGDRDGGGGDEGLEEEAKDVSAANFAALRAATALSIVEYVECADERTTTQKWKLNPSR